MLFNELGLSAELLRAVEEQGYAKPPRFSAKPSPTFSKATIFSLAPKRAPARPPASPCPCCSTLQQRRRPRRIRALVLTPTRELAAQVHESVHTYGKHRPVRAWRSTAALVRGRRSPRSARRRRCHRDAGSLARSCAAGQYRLLGVEMLVLDEADRMLDMGFIRDISRSSSSCRRSGRTCCSRRLSRKRFASWRKSARQSRRDPGSDAQHDGGPRRATRLPGRQARKRELLSEMIGAATGSRCSSLPAPSTAPTAWPSS